MESEEKASLCAEEMEPKYKNKSKKDNVSMITSALSGIVGGALVGTAGGTLGALIGGLVGTSITGLAAYKQLKQLHGHDADKVDNKSKSSDTE